MISGNSLDPPKRRNGRSLLLTPGKSGRVRTAGTHHRLHFAGQQRRVAAGGKSGRRHGDRRRAHIWGHLGTGRVHADRDDIHSRAATAGTVPRITAAVASGNFASSAGAAPRLPAPILPSFVRRTASPIPKIVRQRRFFRRKRAFARQRRPTSGDRKTAAFLGKARQGGYPQLPHTHPQHIALILLRKPSP